MNRRSSALMTKPCPTGAPPAATCAFTGCDRNVGLMPDKNIATTMANGHRLFAPSFLNDIRSSSTCDCQLLLRDNSRPPLRPSGALARTGTVSSHVRRASPPRHRWLRARECGGGSVKTSLKRDVGVRLPVGEERRYSSLAGVR